MTFGEHGSSAEPKRAVSTTRVREFRKRQKLGLVVRTIRISPKQVTKLTTLGYLDFDSRGDEKAEGIAIEAYLGDSLWGTTMFGQSSALNVQFYRRAAPRDLSVQTRPCSGCGRRHPFERAETCTARSHRRGT